MRSFRSLALFLAAFVAAPQAAANLPFLLVTLEAQRAKCVNQHPQLKADFDHAFQSMASRPPKNVPADEWKALILSSELRSDALPGDVTVEECQALAAHFAQLDFDALLEETERAQIEYEAAQREPAPQDPEQ
jgi:hypothetical protein